MKDANGKLRIADNYLDKVQLLCLLIMALMELFIVSLGSWLVYHHPRIPQLGMIGSCGLFLLCELIRMYQTKHFRFPILPCLMVIWFIFIRILHGFMQMDTYSSTLFIPVYLLAFPYAAVSRNGEKQTALKLVALIFIVAGLILTFDAILLLTSNVPEFLHSEMYWDGTRLNVILHANLSARVFMIGIAFCMVLFTQISKKWIKALLAIAALLMFMAMALTNCRSAIVVACLMVAGTVFFSICKDKWKQFFVGAVAALVVLGILLWGANALFDWNSQRLSGAQLQQEQSSKTYAKLSQHTEANTLSHAKTLAFVHEAGNTNTHSLSAVSEGEMTNSDIRPAESPQGTFFGDLLSLNSRTYIWGEVIQGLKREPIALLWGARSIPDLVDISDITHTHNGLIQLLVKLGLPGFIIGLLFSAQALWSAAYLLLSRKAELEKKIVAMLVLCLLVSAMMEPFVFISSEHYHFTDFMFFLCLGYLIQWRKALQKA